jgi:hypothetical protein
MFVAIRAMGYAQQHHWTATRVPRVTRERMAQGIVEGPSSHDKFGPLIVLLTIYLLLLSSFVLLPSWVLIHCINTSRPQQGF